MQRAERARENFPRDQILTKTNFNSISTSSLALRLFIFVRTLIFSYLFQVLRTLRQGKLMKMLHFTGSCFRIQSFPVLPQQILSHAIVPHHFRSGGRRVLLEAFQPGSHAFALFGRHWLDVLYRFSHCAQTLGRSLEQKVKQFYLFFKKENLANHTILHPVMKLTIWP